MENNSNNIGFFSKKKINFIDIFLNFILYSCSITTFLIFISIILYIIINGIPFLSLNFIFSSYSEIIPDQKGILPSLINTMYIVLFTLIMIIPPGIGTAVYLNQYAKDNFLTRLIRSATDVLAGIPSIIFGLFGSTFFCQFLGFGTSIIAGCLTMVICSLPIIIKTSEEALRSIPRSYQEGAQALGVSKLRIILTLLLPSALPGILTAITLTSSKILGESSALIYTAGFSYRMPSSFLSHIFEGGRTLTLHLYQTAKQATTPDAFGLAFASATVLLIIIFLLNIILDFIKFLIKK